MFLYYGLDKFKCFTGLPACCGQQASNFSDVKSMHLGRFNAISISGDGTAYLLGYCDVHDSHKSEHILGPKGVVSKAVLGARAICIVTNSGEILHWRDVGGQPDSVTVSGPVQDVALGNEDALVLQKDGTVGIIIHSKLNVEPVTPLHNIVAVACGMAHNLALTDGGAVFTWGCSNHGELGHGSLDSEEKPKVVEALEGLCVRKIAAGGWHSAAISAYDDLYLWGWNESGQIGALHPSGSRPHKDSVNIAPLPVLFAALGDASFLSVECGSRHTAVLTKSGSVYAWGNNTYGQLGVDEDIKTSHEPHEIQVPQGHTAVGLCCKFWGTLVKCKKIDKDS